MTSPPRPGVLLNGDGTPVKTNSPHSLARSRPGADSGVVRQLRYIGVVVPAHNEEALIEACLDAIAVAAARLPLSVNLCTVVVLDACDDRTASFVEGTRRRWETDPRRPYLHLVETCSRNVGAARRVGCQKLLECTAGLSGDQLWLASTDADSTVAPNWLAHQLEVHAAGNVGWVGTVEVPDHGDLTADRLASYRAAYRHWDGPTHPHVHGTNLGLRGDAYRHIGGFNPYRTGEDHDLLERLSATGLPVARGDQAPVLTSTRLHGRAPDGFAHYLDVLQATPLPVG